MDIAIKFERVNLGDDKCIFKPVGVVFGTYDEETNFFETDYNELCEHITSGQIYENNYFDEVITSEDLFDQYDGLSQKEALAEYYDVCTSCYRIGYFDNIEGITKVVKIPLESLQNCLCQNEEQEQRENIDFNMFFDIDEIKKLTKIKNLTELHDKLDQIISIAVEKKQEIEKIIKKEGSDDAKQNKGVSLQKEKSKEITLKELREEVKSVIKGQDRTVDTVTRTIIINQKSSNPKHKSHMLIIGPSGTGKTEIINIIAKKMKIPYFKADATSYTKEGYVGKSVYSMFDGLIESANGDIEKAQKGLLIIDEIDKKLTKDIAGVDVLNSLLKIMDRDIIELGDGTLFDTSNLTIIFMGAFADIYKSKEENQNKFIGFGVPEEKNKNTIKIITNEDLIKAGMPPEFLGRIPVITNTKELEIEDLIEILYKSKGGAIDEEKEFCKDLGITLKFTAPYVWEVAKKAYQTKTGARNLRKIVRESINDAYDEILSGRQVKVLKLTKKTVLDSKSYYTE